MEFAIHLLNSFLYFSNTLLDQLFVTAFGRLGRRVTNAERRTDKLAEWQSFLDDVVITFPTGEEPSAADSGFIFARRSRDLLDIPEERIVQPDAALERAEAGETRAVVFVDDFVGSGNQFATTWGRDYGGKSFATRTRTEVEAFYLPLFCTSFALEQTLAPLLPKLKLLPIHILGPEYSTLSAESLFWPESMRLTGPEFIEKKSLELGIPDTNGTLPDDWRGFAALGLGLAFEHQIPDASLPLFYATINNWRPLWRKTPQ